MTTNESNTQANVQQVADERSRAFHSMVRFLNLVGIFGFLGAVILLFGGQSEGYTNQRLADAAFNAVFGGLVYACSRVLAQGRVWVIWLFGASIIFSLGYSFVVGRGFNYIMLLIGGVILWRLLALKKNGEIS